MHLLWHISAGLPAYYFRRWVTAATPLRQWSITNYENESHIALQNNEHKITTILSSLQSDPKLDSYFNFLRSFKARHFSPP